MALPLKGATLYATEKTGLNMLDGNVDLNNITVSNKYLTDWLGAGSVLASQKFFLIGEPVGTYTGLSIKNNSGELFYIITAKYRWYDEGDRNEKIYSTKFGVSASNATDEEGIKTLGVTIKPDSTSQQKAPSKTPAEVAGTGTTTAAPGGAMSSTTKIGIGAALVLIAFGIWYKFKN